MSNKILYTPGPWKVEGNKGSSFSYRIISFDGRQIAMIWHHPGTKPKASALIQEIGDAQLVAAAPDLLEILKALVEHAQEKYPHFESERGQAEIATALATIKRAEIR